MKPIESVRRNMHVLECLLSYPEPVPLRVLHQQTRIPKSSLLALLKTLREANVVVSIEGRGWIVTNAWISMVHTYALKRLRQQVLCRQIQSYK